jgi:hypothetical protein
MSMFVWLSSFLIVFASAGVICESKAKTAYLKIGLELLAGWGASEPAGLLLGPRVALTAAHVAQVERLHRQLRCFNYIQRLLNLLLCSDCSA